MYDPESPPRSDLECLRDCSPARGPSRCASTSTSSPAPAGARRWCTCWRCRAASPRARRPKRRSRTRRPPSARGSRSRAATASRGAGAREEWTAAARGQPGALMAAPAGGGRAVGAILHHVADAERSYFTSMLGSVPGLNAALTAVERSGDEIWEPLARARGLIVERLALMTDELLVRLLRK